MTSPLPAPPTPTPAACPETATVPAIVAFFENLTPQSVADLPRFYAPHARFKDPFNEVTGLAAIAHIFEHMFVQLERPRFVVTQQVVQGSQCFLTWEFHFGFKRFKRGQAQVIFGGTHLVLSDQGQITLHRDYWDATEELYEKLPVLGAGLRWLKRQANR